MWQPQKSVQGCPVQCPKGKVHAEVEQRFDARCGVGFKLLLIYRVRAAGRRLEKVRSCAGSTPTSKRRTFAALTIPPRNVRRNGYTTNSVQYTCQLI